MTMFGFLPHVCSCLATAVSIVVVFYWEGEQRGMTMTSTSWVFCGLGRLASGSLHASLFLNVLKDYPYPIPTKVQ